MSAKTVFISSTFKDLKDHRRAVWDALKGFDVLVRGMEDFGARSTTPIETCLAEVEQSDVYVGIIAYRVGSVEPNSNRPYTLLEYEKAVEQSKEILIYLADDEAKGFSQADTDQDPESRSTLDTFKRKLRQMYTVNTFFSPSDLAEKLSRDFRKRFTQHDPSLSADAADEYSQSIRLINDFLLMPARFNGKEVRLSVRFLKSFFPASRALCQKFNLEYGSTVGAHIELLKPDVTKTNWHSTFNELFCRGTSFEALKTLSEKGQAELYAELLFTGDDVPNTRAELFGFSGTAWTAVVPNHVYIPAEGRVILLFSKPVDLTS